MGFQFASRLFRFWLLVHFALFGFGLLLMMLAFALGFARDPFGVLTERQLVTLLAFVIVFALAHIAVFVGILNRTRWAWACSLLLLALHLMQQVVNGLVLKRFHQGEIMYAGLVVFEIAVLTIPGIRGVLGPKVAT